MRVLPLPPQPVMSAAAMAMLQAAARPGVITFVGVCSIVVAVISLLTSLGAAVTDLGLVMDAYNSASTRTPAVVLPTVPMPVLVNTGGTPERIPTNGLGWADRQSFEDGLQRVRTLTVGQVSQLDELLAENGKKLAGNMPVLPDQLATSVTGSGRHEMAGTYGSDYFVLPTGRLELAEDRAVFFPTNGEPSIRGIAINIPTPAFGDVPGSLQPDQIRSIVRTVNQLNGAKIKSAQMKVLITTLQTPAQQIIVPTTDGTDPAYEIISASTSDGMLQISTRHGNTLSAFSVSADGTATHSSSSSISATAAASVPPVINPSAGIAAISLNLLQVLLAIFLLITGIMTLRASPRGRMLHYVYVYLKLPTALATAMVSYWMWASMIQTTLATPAPGASPTPPGAAAVGTAVTATLFGVAPAAVGCIWPIVLIFVLLRKDVQIFYASRTTRRLNPQSAFPVISDGR